MALLLRLEKRFSIFDASMIFPPTEKLFQAIRYELLYDLTIILIEMIVNNFYLIKRFFFIFIRPLQKRKPPALIKQMNAITKFSADDIPTMIKHIANITRTNFNTTI